MKIQTFFLSFTIFLSILFLATSSVAQNSSKFEYQKTRSVGMFVKSTDSFWKHQLANKAILADKTVSDAKREDILTTTKIDLNTWSEDYLYVYPYMLESELVDTDSLIGIYLEQLSIGEQKFERVQDYKLYVDDLYTKAMGKVISEPSEYGPSISPKDFLVNLSAFCDNVWIYSDVDSMYDAHINDYRMIRRDMSYIQTTFADNHELMDDIYAIFDNMEERKEQIAFQKAGHKAFANETDFFNALEKYYEEVYSKATTFEEIDDNGVYVKFMEAEIDRYISDIPESEDANPRFDKLMTKLQDQKTILYIKSCGFEPLSSVEAMMTDMERFYNELSAQDLDTEIPHNTEREIYRLMMEKARWNELLTDTQIEKIKEFDIELLFENLLRP